MKIICLDCDGTLINDKNELTDYSYKVLKKLCKNNIIVYATGRNLKDFLFPFKKRKVLGDYLVSNHGAVIYDLKNDFNVYKKFVIDKKDFENYYNTIIKNGFKNFRLGKLPDNNLNKYLKLNKDILSVDMYFNQKDVEKVYELLKNNNKISTFIMQDSFNDYKWICSQSTECDKGYAISYLIKRKNLIGELICIGDSINDLSMLNIADIKVAMGNALDIVKQKCDYVAPSFKDDGACKWLENYILNKDK